MTIHIISYWFDWSHHRP